MRGPSTHGGVMDVFKRHAGEVCCVKGPRCKVCCNDKKLARKRGRRRMKQNLRRELNI